MISSKLVSMHVFGCFTVFLHGHVNNQDTKTKHNQQVITLSMGESIGAE